MNVIKLFETAALDNSKELWIKWKEAEEGILPAFHARQKRRYYQRVWGWDPIATKIPVALFGDYKWEVWFPLTKDPSLFAANIMIGARVYRRSWGTSMYSRIVFHRPNICVHSCIRDNMFSPCSRGYNSPSSKCLEKDCLLYMRDGLSAKEREVGCVHIAITQITPEQLPETIAQTSNSLDLNLEGSQTSENKQVNLEPEEHFMALRSYVAGIADMGLEAMFTLRYSDSALGLPFGFNALMQKQILDCLLELCPAAAKSIQQRVIGELLETAPVEWLQSRVNLLISTYHLMTETFDDAFLQALPESAKAKIDIFFPPKQSEEKTADLAFQNQLQETPHFEIYSLEHFSLILGIFSLILGIRTERLRGVGINEQLLSHIFNERGMRGIGEYIRQFFRYPYNPLIT